jgi:hypothetical protein
MAARLAAIYANPGLGSVAIVSARLAERLPETVSPSVAASATQQEAALRQLGGLPPYAPLYRLRVLAAGSAVLQQARKLIGEALFAHPGTSLLRLGRPFPRLRRWELHGYLLNPQLGWQELQQLRWQVHALQASLGLHVLRGPWL